MLQRIARKQGFPAALAALMLIAASPLAAGLVGPALAPEPPTIDAYPSPGTDPCPWGNTDAQCALPAPEGSECVATAILLRGSVPQTLSTTSALDPPAAGSEAQVLNVGSPVSAKVAHAQCDFGAAIPDSACTGAPVGGRAEVTGFDSKIGLVIHADVLRDDGCSGYASLQDNHGTITNLFVGTFPPIALGVDQPQNTVLPLGVGFLVINEHATGTYGKCLWSSGSAVRLVLLDPVVELRIGWVSTMDCGPRDDPTITTTSNPTGNGVAPGTSVRDTAVVTGTSGLPGPSGTVTFSICTPSQVSVGLGCLAPAGTQVGGPLSLVGGSATSSTTSAVAGGTSCWRVFYAGDYNYNQAPHTNYASECFTTKLTPSLSTTSNPTGTVFVGQQARDTATVTGTGGTPTGTVTFFFCTPSTGTIVVGSGCTAGGINVGTVSLSGGTATSALTGTNTAVGVHCWRAEYSGDATYLAATHTNYGSECFTQQKRTPSIVTYAHWQDPGFNGRTFDRSWINATGGGPVPTGTVTFFLCGPLANATGCGAGGAANGTRTLPANTNNFVDSDKFDDIVLADFKWFCYRAEYSGDANYNSVTHTNTGSECFFTVRPQ